jgi:dTDP-4-dehydrorhamnose reductase
VWVIATTETGGTFHWTDAGVASWYDFAVAIAEEAVARGVLPAMPAIAPIATADYPTPARRPAYSVLDKSATMARFGIRQHHWRARLRDVIGELSSA